MKTRAAVMTLLIASAAAATSCATAPKSAPSAATATPAGAPAATPGHAGHETAGHEHDMGSHSRAELAFLFPDGDDKGWMTVENGTQHDMAPDVPLVKLPPAERAELIRQLALTLEPVKKYPTVKDAEAAGYHRAGPFIPGLGAHYVGGRMNRTGTLTDDDILRPSTIVYHGTAPDSPIAGFMYMSIAMGTSGKEPVGFAGPNDRWHYHTGVCIMPGANGSTEALGFDGSITAADCKAKGGNFIAATQYLLHVWTAPAYTNPLGVFAHANPALTCSDGTYYTGANDPTRACRRP